MSTMLNFIDHRWVAGPTGAHTINPSTGDPVGDYSTASAVEAEEAVAAARRAFETTGWVNNPRRRASAILEMADHLQRRRQDIVDAAVAESGKRTVEIGHEFDAAVSELRYYAGLARTIFGRMQEVGEGAFSLFAREPIGVVAIIVPWNAPITLLVRSLGPVLAAGCTCVIKPAPQTSITNGLMMQAFRQAESLPRGVINSVNDHGSEVGKLLVAHKDIDAISFTGSHATAVRIMEAAAGSLKRLNLELGGKAPAIVFADAELDVAAAGITRGAFAAAGQMCTAVTRVIVEDAAYEAMKSRLTERFSTLRVGPANDPVSEMGPVIDSKSLDRLQGVIDRFRADAIVAGAVPSGLPSGGFYLTPSLIAADDLSSPLVQDELFGPIVTIERFSDEAEAAHMANATVWGLAASVWTRDNARAFRLSRALKSGTVWINAHNRLFAEAETGGYKQSGLGRLHGLEGLNVFLETKHVFLEPGWVPSVELTGLS